MYVYYFVDMKIPFWYLSTIAGAYHFAHPEEDADTQAEFFHSSVGAFSKGDLAILDIESTVRGSFFVRLNLEQIKR